MRKLIIALTLMVSTVHAQSLVSAATGVDTGTGVSRSIMRITSRNTIERISTRRNSIDSLASNSQTRLLSRFALDLNNVEEITLQDGSVIKKEEIIEALEKKFK